MTKKSLSLPESNHNSSVAQLTAEVTMLTILPPLVKHDCEYTIVRWIRATLEGRVAVVTLNETSMRVAISKGCLQGGVLLLLLWCLVVNDLLTRLTGGGVFIQGYADDMSSRSG
jgi:hypothetical protein